MNLVFHISEDGSEREIMSQQETVIMTKPSGNWKVKLWRSRSQARKILMQRQIISSLQGQLTKAENDY